MAAPVHANISTSPGVAAADPSNEQPHSMTRTGKLDTSGASCTIVRIAVPVGCLTGAAVVFCALFWTRYVTAGIRFSSVESRALDGLHDGPGRARRVDRAVQTPT